MQIYTLKDKNRTLILNLDNNIIKNATANEDKNIVISLCDTLKGMDIANATYYGAKLTYEKNYKDSNSISFIEKDPILKNYDSLLKKFYYSNDFDDSFRFESIKLNDWKKQSDTNKYKRLNHLINTFFKDYENYKENYSLIKVHDNSFEVNLSYFIKKDDIHEILVKLESYIRNELNIPIIITIQEISDANKKRK